MNRPYWKESHRCYYANLRGKTVRLDPDKKKAWKKFSSLVAAPPAEILNGKLDLFLVVKVKSLDDMAIGELAGLCVEFVGEKPTAAILRRLFRNASGRP